jgi:hypothetical protein
LRRAACIAAVGRLSVVCFANGTFGRLSALDVWGDLAFLPVFLL